MSVPAIVERAAQMAANDHRGIISFQIEQNSRVDGGPIHKTAHCIIVAAYDNEQLIRIRVIRYEENGKDAGADRMRALEKDLSAHSEGFAVPFDRAHFGEYTYEVPDDTTVRFSSALHDVRHGSGSFQVGADGHVRHLHYTPNVLPQYANTGTIDEEREQVLPGFWATVRSVQHYSGRYLLIRGSADVTMTESHFTRYATRAEATAAVVSQP